MTTPNSLRYYNNAKRNQKGAGSSEFNQFWHSTTIDNRNLSRYTLKHIENSPMFHPFEKESKFATPTTGIVPTGISLAQLGLLKNIN